MDQLQVQSRLVIKKKRISILAMNLLVFLGYFILGYLLLTKINSFNLFNAGRLIIVFGVPAHAAILIGFAFVGLLKKVEIQAMHYFIAAAVVFIIGGGMSIFLVMSGLLGEVSL